MSTITESDVESAALSWLADTGWRTAHGPDIAPGMSDAERSDCADVILAQRLRDAFARLNPDPPARNHIGSPQPRLAPPDRGRRDGPVTRLRRHGAARLTRSTSTTPPTTTGWRSTSSPSWRTGTNADLTWCCSSTGCRWRSSSCEEPSRRRGHHLDRLAAVADLQGRNPLAVRLQRRVRRVGRTRRPRRYPDTGGSGSSPGARFRARRWPTRTCRSCR